MYDVKFKEVQATGYETRQVSPAELYKLVEENSGVRTTYQDFIYKIGLEITKAPTMECRFHINERSTGKHIEAICRSVEIAEEMTRLDKGLH